MSTRRASDPISLFSDSRWTTGVIGLGYVGLPLLVTAVRRGLGGIGYDVSADLVAELSSGRSHVDDVSDVELEKVLADGAELTSNAQRLSDADAVFICVPSPLGRNRQPDLSFIEEASATIEQIARPGQLIVLESTSYPGTTEEYLVPAIERAGLTLDEDVFLAFSPERVSPGDALKTGEIPKVVGGVTELSGDVAEAAYRCLVPEVHRVSSARAAEMAKLLENTYRAVNIGLINEIAQLSHELEIDIWEVIDAAATKPFGFQAFYPGPGVGGHCIPLDPQYLAWRARASNVPTRFIETADQVNARMPDYTVERIGDLLNRMGRPFRESRILVVGIAYKRDVSDDRESASLEVARRMAKRGADVAVLDPHVGDDRITAHGFAVESGDQGFAGYDLAVVLTDHSDIPYEEIVREVPQVFDGRGVYRRLGLQAGNVEAL